MVVLDSTVLALLLNPATNPPIDPSTGAPVTHIGARLKHLEAEMQRTGETIVIPTPVLSEVLVGLGEAGPAALELINKSARFKVAEFDQRAAVEVAAMTQDAIIAGDKKSGSSAPWQKVKIDRQIIAVARVNGAKCIYSDDGNLASFAAKLGLAVVRTWELPMPPVSQGKLFED